jgi:hypothetical protein
MAQVRLAAAADRAAAARAIASQAQQSYPNGSDKAFSPVHEIRLKRIAAINALDQTRGLDHVGFYPQFDLSPVSSQISVRNAQVRHRLIAISYNPKKNLENDMSAVIALILPRASVAWVAALIRS